MMSLRRIVRGKKDALYTEGQVFVQVFFTLARVGEGDFIECDNGRREFANILKMEAQWSRGFYFLDESRCFHLIDNFLFRLGLPDEVGICTSGSNESKPIQ
jgi:hypothetical protein